MPGHDLEPYTGLVEQADSLAACCTSSAELVAAALARAETAQNTIHAFRVIRAELAMREAMAADRRLAEGERLPLLGVPVAIKDDSDLSGESTPFGCAGEFRPKTADGEAVRRLRAAGAVVIGKTHTPEFGLYPWTEGTFGATRNPWNLDYTPGGSSGGSAAAVAAGIVAGAMGSDGAGSVRIPASWTNLVGIKPQRGRVSTWPDAEAFNGITCNGPLARTVADAALLLDATTGNHPGDRHRPAPPSGRFVDAARRPPRRLRIALSFATPLMYVRTAPEPAVVAAVRRTADILAALGHRVEEADVRFGLIGLPFVPRAAAGVADWALRAPDQALLDPRTRSSAAAGQVMSGVVLRGARLTERPIAARMARMFRTYDVVLAPTTAWAPLRVGAADGLSNWATERLMARACPYAWPWNFLGWPAISVPAGFTPTGLPVGAQLMGPAHSEARLISLAAELEQECRWFDRHPPAA